MKLDPVKIAPLQKERKVTVTTIASETKISRSYLSLLLNGRAPIYRPALNAIAKYFGVKPETIIDESFLTDAQRPRLLTEQERSIQKEKNKLSRKTRSSKRKKSRRDVCQETPAPKAPQDMSSSADPQIAVTTKHPPVDSTR